MGSSSSSDPGGCAVVKSRNSESASICSSAAWANLCAKDVRAAVDTTISPCSSCRKGMRASTADIARLSGEVVYGRVLKASVEDQCMDLSGSNGEIGGGSIGKYW